MNISEIQTLLLYAITTGVFLGFIIGVLLSLLARRE